MYDYDLIRDLYSFQVHLLFIELFKVYTLSPPKSTNRKPDKRTGKFYYSLIFKTRMLPCFNYLWYLLMYYRYTKKEVPKVA